MNFSNIFNLIILPCDWIFRLDFPRENFLNNLKNSRVIELSLLNCIKYVKRRISLLNRDPRNTAKALAFLPRRQVSVIRGPSGDRLDESRCIHDRNKYGVKRARILFTERYNCQKNKRSQSLFAHVFLHHLHQRGGTLRTLSSGAFPPLCPVTSPVPFGVLVSPFISSLWLPLPTYHHRVLSLSVPRVSVSFSSTFNHPVATPVEKLTLVAGQRIRNYDLSRWRDYLLSSSTLVRLAPSSSRIAMHYLEIFSGKSITKADNARLFKHWYPFSRKYTDIWEMRSTTLNSGNRK